MGHQWRQHGEARQVPAAADRLAQGQAAHLLPGGLQTGNTAVMMVTVVVMMVMVKELEMGLAD